MTQTTIEHKTQLWIDRITSWQQSGLSQRAYCEQHQLVLDTFAYWRSRLKRLKVDNPADKPRFLPVTLKQHSHESLTLLINGQHHLEIRSDFDSDFLTRIVQAVQKAA